MIKRLRAYRRKKIDMKSREEYKELYELECEDCKRWQIMAGIFIVADAVIVVVGWLSK